MLAALTDLPFGVADPLRVHVFILKSDPMTDAAALGALALSGDRWHISPGRFAL